jgi:hypothetical protein
MTAGRNEGLPERLHLLALGVLLHRPGVVAVGVDLACDLLVAGLDTPATVEVAGLRRDATLGDSEELLRSMLEEHGVQIPVPQTDADKFAALRLAFGFLNLPVSEFEGPFYERLPEWGEQDSLDRSLVILFDQRDHQADPVRRTEVEDRMRDAIREAEPRAAG